MKDKLNFIGNLLLLIIVTAIFIFLVYALGIVAILLLAQFGVWVGLGQDVFIWVVQIIATWKAWDLLTWIIGKIAFRKEDKQ